MIERCTFDWESRSAMSLRNHGAWRYSIDATTDILCGCYRLPYWSEGRTGVWFPARLGMEMGDSDWTDFLELVDWIESGERIEAHNAAFEQALWRNIAVPRYGFPEVPASSWMCSAAKAAAHSLPRGLDDALAALKLRIRKDAEGSKVMLKMTKPRKPRKAEREAWTVQHGPTPHPVIYFESGALLTRLIAYCRQDVLAEEALSHALDDLSEQEQQVYLLDQRINQRGFQLDAKAVQFALGAIEKESTRLNGELSILTGGYAEKATQRIHLLEWLRDHGCDMDDTQKATVELTLEEGVDPTVARTLTILQMLGRSSTAKYQKMASHMAPDGRVRGGMLYHGASTGRWSGSGVQPHNFPKATLEKTDPLYSQEALWTHLLSGKPVDDIMSALSHGLRGAIIAPEGRQLFCGDYAAIEARVIPWLAGDEDTLDIFRKGEDLYCSFASDIYGRVITKADTSERTLGKVASLALSFGMGWQKFIAAAATYGLDIEDDFAQQTVNAYRTRFWRIKQLWRDQEDAAIQAVRLGGVAVPCGKVVWHVEDKFLYATLPGGKRIAYPFPSIGLRETPWGGKHLGLSFMGVNPVTRKWQRQGTYGGSICENLTQSVARNLMAEALLRIEATGIYEPVLSVHDEILAEADDGVGNVKEFEALMAMTPEWADGLPVAAEGWGPARRYHK